MIYEGSGLGEKLLDINKKTLVVEEPPTAHQAKAKQALQNLLAMQPEAVEECVFRLKPKHATYLDGDKP